MRDRLGAVRGHIEISSHPGQGTLVTATAPLRRDRNDPKHPQQAQAAQSTVA